MLSYEDVLFTIPQKSTQDKQNLERKEYKHITK